MSTVDPSEIRIGRPALPIRDILKALRDIYPKAAELFIPPPLRCFETIVTALCLMTSPDQDALDSFEINHDSVAFRTRQSVFDLHAGMPVVVAAKLMPTFVGMFPCNPVRQRGSAL